MSLHLRCLSTIELLLHSGYYANHPQTSGLIRDGKSLDENTLFSLMLAETAFKVFEKNNKKHVYRLKPDASGPPFKRRKQSTLERFITKGLSAYFPFRISEMSARVFGLRYFCFVHFSRNALGEGSNNIQLFYCSFSS